MTKNSWKIVVALLALSPALARAVPSTVGFSARLSDAGTPVSGTHTFTFSFWDVATGGDAGANRLWTEDVTLAVANGAVSVSLGNVAALPAGLFNGAPLYLEVAIDGGAPFSPRMAVNSVPYAIRAGAADTAGTAATASALACTGCVGDAQIASVAYGKVVGAPPAARVATATNTATNTIAASPTCTNATGGSVTIAAPTAGIVVVRATASLKINHTTTPDGVYAVIGTSPSDCSDTVGRFYGRVSAAEVSQVYDVTLAPTRSFAVTANSTNTYYLNATMTTGQDPNDTFSAARLEAVFFPN